MSKVRGCGKEHEGLCYQEMGQANVMGICDDCGRVVRRDLQPQPVQVDSLPALIMAMMGRAEEALVARCPTCAQVSA